LRPCSGHDHTFAQRHGAKRITRMAPCVIDAWKQCGVDVIGSTESKRDVSGSIHRDTAEPAVNTVRYARRVRALLKNHRTVIRASQLPPPDAGYFSVRPVPGGNRLIGYDRFVVAEVPVRGTEERPLPVTLVIKPDGSAGLWDTIASAITQSHDRIEWRACYRVCQRKAGHRWVAEIRNKFPHSECVLWCAISAVRVLGADKEFGTTSRGRCRTIQVGWQQPISYHVCRVRRREK
jgi:hypothetical protein